MDQIYPNDGLLLILARVSQDGGSGNRWRLFSNNKTPDHGDTLADYVPVSWANASVPFSAFTDLSVEGDKAIAIAPPIEFENDDETIDVYGYYVTDSTQSNLIAVARFDDAPRSVPPGYKVAVTPAMATFSEI